MGVKIGTVDCPHCRDLGKTTVADVCQESRGRAKALYYRCGECGTVQIRLPGGQAWINKNMRPLDLDARQQASDDAAATAAEETREAAKKAAVKKRREAAVEPTPVPVKPGVLEKLFGGDGT